MLKEFTQFVTILHLTEDLCISFYENIMRISTQNKEEPKIIFFDAYILNLNKANLVISHTFFIFRK